MQSSISLTNFHFYSFIENTPNSVLIDLPTGKPDPREEYTGINPDGRPRVFQKGQKGDTCCYYAMNMLRERIGPNVPESSSPAIKETREFELLCSIRRKEISEQNFHDQIETLNQLKETPDFARYLTNKIDAQTLYNFYQKINEDFSTSQEDKATSQRVVRAVGKFLQQEEYPDFTTFANAEIQALKTLKYDLRQRTNTCFFKTLGINPKTMYVSDQSILREASLPTGDLWESLTEEKRCFFMDNFAFRISYDRFDLKESSWKPSDPIQTLIRSLKTFGPHQCLGKFGQANYNAKPELLGKIGDRNIVFWKKGTRKDVLQPIFHSIVVIGARHQTSNSSGYIYYVDPQDCSDPEDRKSQIVYCLSYERFKTELANLNSRRMHIQKSEDIVPIETIPYLIHKSAPKYT